MDFWRQILNYLQSRENARLCEQNKLRLYEEVARILWFDVAYCDVCETKRHKMDSQLVPFRREDGIGSASFLYNGIKALSSTEERQRFASVATRELRDKGYKCRVAVFPDAIRVDFS